MDCHRAPGAISSKRGSGQADAFDSEGPSALDSTASTTAVSGCTDEMDVNGHAIDGDVGGSPLVRVANGAARFGPELADGFSKALTTQVGMSR